MSPADALIEPSSRARKGSAMKSKKGGRVHKEQATPAELAKVYTIVDTKTNIRKEASLKNFKSKHYHKAENAAKKAGIPEARWGAYARAANAAALELWQAVHKKK